MSALKMLVYSATVACTHGRQLRGCPNFFVCEAVDKSPTLHTHTNSDTASFNPLASLLGQFVTEIIQTDPLPKVADF